MEALLLLSGLGGIAYVINKSQKEPAAASEPFSNAGGPVAVSSGVEAGRPLVVPSVESSNGTGHNNMMPYHNASSSYRMYQPHHSTEATLDSYTGMHDATYLHKQETLHMGHVKPDAGNPVGMPVRTDFMQSRIEGPVRAANYFPVERVNVAPGLNSGYGTEGVGGYQQTEVLNIAQAAIKSTDELRVADKPKISYSTPAVPGGHYVQTAHGPEGAPDMPHYRPDKFFINGPDRWMTTTGVEKGDRQREDIVMKDQNRESTDVNERYGAAQSAAWGAQSYIRPVLEPFMQFVKLTVGEYFGGSGSAATGAGPSLYDVWKTFRQNYGRNELEAQRAPVAHGDKTYVSEDGVNLQIRKDEAMAYHNRVNNSSRLNPQASSHEAIGAQHVRDRLGGDHAFAGKLDPVQLTGLSSNPYHIGLNTDMMRPGASN